MNFSGRIKNRKEKEDKKNKNKILKKKEKNCGKLWKKKCEKKKKKHIKDKDIVKWYKKMTNTD